MAPRRRPVKISVGLPNDDWQTVQQALLACADVLTRASMMAGCVHEWEADRLAWDQSRLRALHDHIEASRRAAGDKVTRQRGSIYPNG
jgi:outer membrane murein-binding lipoprotein Lpp